MRLDDETHANLVKVYRSGETLLSLINDILDISKIEANKLELNLAKYDLPSLLNDSITQSILYLGEKPVELILNINENLPRYLYGDELRVKQIMNNLLSNAFKFTKEGTVELNVQCDSEENEDAVWLTIRVRDTGIGIQPKDYNKLFTLYGKMEEENCKRDSNRRIEGTGLGLSICKKIAEMMGGSITVESEYGKGSIFTVKLKQKHIDDSKIGADVVESLKKFHYSIDKFRNIEKKYLNLSYARVLVVDDNIANLDVAKGLMSLYEMTVDCVTSGQQAINAIREEKVLYNAIFMDHMMPEMDGIEATQLIRKINTNYAKTIPIIALTANAIAGSEEMFLSKGFQAFIAKPIDLVKLDSILKRWVRNKSQIFNSDIIGVDINKGIAHFGSKEEIFYDVLQSYAKNTKPLIDKLKEVNANNLEQYAVIVHGIKGASNGIFAEAAANEALALEMAAKDGNFNFVNANNKKFIDTVSCLVANIENALAKCNKKQKSIKDKPDNASLAKLLAACENYDIDEIDSAIANIENYAYNSDNGLVAWLRENIDKGKIKIVKEKLQKMEIKEI